MYSEESQARGLEVQTFFMNHMLFLRPRRVVPPLSWAQHVPFAFTLIERHKPGLLVELGTHTGVSFCAFCQAVSHLGLPTQCYAVDTWKGDEHAGLYEESVWENLQQYHQKYYSGFSTLMRMTFDEALPYFSDRTVDLLHIDGCHDYEAVKHDFESWLPRVSPRGLVLLHDTAVRDRGFGVWRFLEELKGLYPVFEFYHSHGLAVVGVGENIQKELKDLFELDQRHATHLRQMYEALGREITLEDKITNLKAEVASLSAQLNEVINSRSWRYAEPLRRIRRLMGRVVAD